MRTQGKVVEILDPHLPPPTQPFEDRDMSGVVYAIVHHSDTPLDTTVAAIDQGHRARGFIYVGYHFEITTDGKVYAGRPITAVPAAAEGFNTDSVDICLIGDFQSDDPGYNGPPSAQQIYALEQLLVQVHQQVPSITATKGHGELMPDDCPGDKVKLLLPAIKQYVYDQLQKGKS